ncbi:LysR family transcriptional regulator [Brevirhabdus pacifica]|uniref:LysR family transcriptional regulator n=1 Tax=Brevirhabdus pacifica TaxID=1267768 RepID=UPI001A8E102D|nr:LysR family transcriptional regulator [Brevirhabdus pacifica]
MIGVNLHKSGWDDFRYVLAVAEMGSVSSAARRLGVNHATVLRRVAMFEERWECPVFERTPRGYVVLPDRLRLIEAIRQIDGAVSAAERQIGGIHSPLSGTVRVTSTDTFCHAVLPPLLSGLCGEEDELSVQLICSNGPVELGRLKADLTVRPTQNLPEDLDGICAAQLGFAAYAGIGAEDDALPWLELGGVLRRSGPAEWMEANVSPDRVVGGADSFITLREMAVAGLGRALLPCVIADADPRLRLLRDTARGLSVPIWVACHAELSEVPRIRVVRSRLAQALERQADRLLGAAGQAG